MIPIRFIEDTGSYAHRTRANAQWADLTASGYVGSDVEDCLAGLLRTCNYNIELLREDGIDLDFEPEALSAIAEAALNLWTGARGLRIVMEKVMRDIMFDAPKAAAIDHAAALTLKKEYIMPTLRKEYKLAE